jgi:OCT family organic cation transporter-like MFS transporter 4/5
VEEAKLILEKGVKRNGRQWPEGFELVATGSNNNKKDSSEEQQGSGATFVDLFRTPNLRKNTLIQYFNWFTASFVYYALTFDSGTLSVDYR